MTSEEKDEMRKHYSEGMFAMSESQIEEQIKHDENREKEHKIYMRNELIKIFLFWPVFLGIWIATGFAWGFLIGLAIGWLPALIGGGIVYLIFRIEHES